MVTSPDSEARIRRSPSDVVSERIGVSGRRRSDFRHYVLIAGARGFQTGNDLGFVGKIVDQFGFDRQLHFFLTTRSETDALQNLGRAFGPLAAGRRSSRRNEERVDPETAELACDMLPAESPARLTGHPRKSSG